MKKTILTLSLLFAFSGLAYADGNAFTPLNFNDTSYGTTTQNGAVNVISENEAVGNGNIPLFTIGICKNINSLFLGGTGRDLPHRIRDCLLQGSAA